MYIQDRKTRIVEIFQDSYKMMKENSRLQQSIKSSISAQRLYLELDSVSIPESKNRDCKTVLSKKRTLEAASDYAKAGKKVCVLNFASATNPGGGVKGGSSAQEESICRCSTLYPCLNTNALWNKFYEPHRIAKNPLYNADCIYTPDVIVFKTDISFPERMPEKNWYNVDIITCAAPNLRKKPSNSMNPNSGDVAANISNKDLYELLLKRIERIFRVAVANGAEVLILGAFGCGAFCNPPELVAKAFREIQGKYKTYFETIEYAVFCKGFETQNYDAFEKIIFTK